MRLGEHMLDDDILFPRIYGEICFCIFQGDMRVILPMGGTFCVSCLALSPVIQEEVVQQSSPGCGYIIQAE